ncbi:MAG: hypothetical protein JWQ28_1746, partial [Pedobacter sp.]|nr:hypothetical protein [Pedobacter sp.]
MTENDRPPIVVGSFSAIFRSKFLAVFFLALAFSISAYAQTDLQITQSLSNHNPRIGDLITLTLTAQNIGNKSATNVTVNDLLPFGFTYKSTSTGANYLPGTGVWSIGTMTVSSSLTLTIQVEVTSNDSYINVANISGTEIENNLTNNVSTDFILPVYDISGNIFHDVNGFTDSKTNNSSVLPLFSPIYVSLLDDSKTILATMAVAADQKFVFQNKPGGSYQLVLHNNPSGSSTSTLPSGWVNTSEGFSGGSDNIPDGTLLFKTNSVDASELVLTEDFGPGVGIGPALAIGVTTYTYKDPVASGIKLADGSYTIASNARQGSDAWQDVSDHTTPGTNDGRFLLVNADVNPKEFYRRKVTGLLPNQAYQLTFWAINVNSKADYDYCSGTSAGFVFPNIKYSILNGSNSSMIRSGSTGVIAYSATAQWVKYTFDFNTANATAVDFILANTAPGGCGNDLGIDDISLRKVPSISINSVSADFGVQEKPKVDLAVTSIRLQNPGGSIAVDIPSSGFSGTDDGTIDFVKITSFPINVNALIANGITYTSATFPAEGIKIDYKNLKVQLDPIEGTVQTAIDYKIIDNLGFESLNSGKLNVFFEALSVAFSGSKTVNEKDGFVKYTVTLNGTSGLVTSYPISLQTGVNAGSAGASDYSLNAGVITFPAGSVVGSQLSFIVNITDDLIVEGAEDYTASISVLSGGVILTNANIVTTITDNDQMGIVLSGPSTVTEGGEVTYIATLTGTAGVSIQDAVSVDYKTADGSAKAGTDYISSTGKLTFAAGAVSGATQPFTVNTTDDKLVEGPETYKASISNLSTTAGAGISIDTTGIVTTITDNDQLRIVLSGPSTVTEGGEVTYIATLVGTAGVSVQDAVSVDYKTADGSAKAGTDYISSTGKLTFAAGALTGAKLTFTVKTTDDKLVEAPETYKASISNLSTTAGAGISIDTTGIVTTITDNDQLRIVLSGPSTVTEGGEVTYIATLVGTA